MKRLYGAVVAMVCSMLAGCSEPQREVQSVNIEEVRQHLQTIASARILLGHQSVGRDILAGVRALSAEAGVPLRIEEITGLPPDENAGLFHSHIGKNGDPNGKCEAFEYLLTRPEKPQYDLAMMKFCYVDLARDTSMQASAMLDRYSHVIERLSLERPDVQIVHVTLPLKNQWRGWKVTVNRLLGREVAQDSDNAARNVFNERLREKFGQQPFFDLAGLESTYADGSRSSFEFDGRTMYSLADEYTHDGGHLNEQGQRLVAAEFVKTLATTLQTRRAKGSAAEQLASGVG